MRSVNFVKLSRKQEVVLSEIFRDAAQVFFASAVVSPLLLGAENSDDVVLVSGIILSSLLWILSVIIVKE
jgi:hypothetical protein